MDWEKTLKPPTATLGETISSIDASAAQICLVVDEENRLLGTVTDGDIRRAIMGGLGMDEAVTRAMNTQPITVPDDTMADDLLGMMKARRLHQIPLVDGGGRVVGLAHLDDLLDVAGPRDNWVVIIAGGLGSRLRPLTADTPKPLLEVGGKPILELIVDNLVRQNFRRFYLSVNYKADFIKEFFGDGSTRGIEIRYLEESQSMGTAGPLGLIPTVPAAPVLVMNGDLLTKVNFAHLMDYHAQSGAAATMAVREYDFEVPFGVVRADGTRLVDIEEKPVHRFLINAGIYVFEPHALKSVASDQYLEMPDLFRRLMDAGQESAVFPIREYWLDIGRFDDYERAQEEFTREFE